MAQKLGTLSLIPPVGALAREHGRLLGLARRPSLARTHAHMIHWHDVVTALNNTSHWFTAPSAKLHHRYPVDSTHNHRTSSLSPIALHYRAWNASTERHNSGDPFTRSRTESLTSENWLSSETRPARHRRRPCNAIHCGHRSDRALATAPLAAISWQSCDVAVARAASSLGHWLVVRLVSPAQHSRPPCDSRPPQHRYANAITAGGDARCARPLCSVPLVFTRSPNSLKYILSSHTLTTLFHYSTHILWYIFIRETR